MPEEAYGESQHNNSLVFATEYEEDNGPKANSADIIPGTNDTATQADRSSDLSKEVHTSPLFGTLKTYSQQSRDESHSPVRYLQSMPNIESTPQHSTPSLLQRSASDSYAKDTQVIGSEHTEIRSEKALAELGDTQVIGHQIDLGDTQVIRPNVNGHTDDTQRIVPVPLDDATQVIGRRNSVWESTQPITQVVGGYAGTQVTSSPRANDSEYTEEHTTTMVLSPVQREQEPTTQVLNTQEEVFLPGKEPVDLSCKPVLLSSQKDNDGILLQREHDLSIISNDDKDEQFNGIFYEDSLFKHKLKKTQADELEERRKHLLIPRKTSWSQSSSQTPAGSSLTVRKTSSQSSSDLEDISQDVSGLDLDILRQKLSEDIPMLPEVDESREHINLPKKRRINHIAGSQSQTAELDAITEENLATLAVEHLENDRGVWAYFQFRYYPARVLRPIDPLHTLVEFYDWCQKEMKNTDLFVLDVRIGDNLRTFMAPSEYVVTRMTTTDEAAFRCVRGFDTLHLSKKGKHNVASGGELTVSLSTCYMEPDDWAMHQLRFQLLYEGVDLVQRDYGAIQPLLQLLDSSQKTENFEPVLEPKTKSPRKAKPERSESYRLAPIFGGRVFFITSMAPERKTTLKKTIEDRGGLVYDSEIRDLVSFQVSSSYHLRISLQNFLGISFGAFLSDGHSRSAKYLQALALGWPILADNFVEQAIEDQDILENWLAFLLPAGQSFYTKNLKSQDVFRFRLNLENGVVLNDQFNNNSDLMATLNVLIFQKRQDKQTLRMCEFIFHAFGAQTLQAFNNENHLKSHIAENKDMSFLVLDNNQREIEKACKSNGPAELAKFGIIDWEWVVQCTISGFVWRPTTYGFVSL